MSIFGQPTKDEIIENQKEKITKLTDMLINITFNSNLVIKDMEKEIARLKEFEFKYKELCK